MFTSGSGKKLVASAAAMEKARALLQDDSFVDEKLPLDKTEQDIVCMSPKQNQPLPLFPSSVIVSSPASIPASIPVVTPSSRTESLNQKGALPIIAPRLTPNKLSLTFNHLQMRRWA